MPKVFGVYMCCAHEHSRVGMPRVFFVAKYSFLTALGFISCLDMLHVLHC